MRQWGEWQREEKNYACKIIQIQPLRAKDHDRVNLSVRSSTLVARIISARGKMFVIPLPRATFFFVLYTYLFTFKILRYLFPYYGFEKKILDA